VISRRSLLSLIAAVIALLTFASLGTPALAAPGGNPTLTGKFIFLHADAADREVNLPAIEVGAQTYRLHGQSFAHFKPGQPIRVTGAVTGHDVAVSTATATSNVVAGAPSALNVLVELVYWTSPDSVTTAQAQQQYDVTNNAWFNNESYGHMTEHATATNWLAIAAPTDPDGAGPNTPCDNITPIQAEGDAAAAAAGHDPAAYTNVVYYYPSCPAEQWGGWGQVGGNRTWLIGEMDTRVAVHELGHNLGLNHSHSETCTLNGTTVPYASTCTADEYGDPVSIMGGGFSGAGMYAANQQTDLGWLDTTGHAVTTVSGSGTYVLVPLESMSGGVQALRMTNANGVEFWIEYRQPLANDSFAWSDMTNGVLIHSSDGTYSNLYDMRVATPGNFNDAALPVGSTWTDPTSPLSVTVNSASASGASVTISMTSTCPDAAFEPDNTPIQARSQAVGTTSSHAFCTANDQDWTKFAATAGTTYDLQTLNLSSTTDTVLNLYGLDGTTLIASNDDNSGLASRLTFTPTTSGTYYLMASQFGGAGSSTRTYDLQLASVSTATRYEDTAAQYEGWFVWSDPTANGGTWRNSSTVNNTASFAFTGTAVTWVSSKGTSRGIAAVTIDGVSKGTVDLYSSATGTYVKTFAGLTNAAHTIVIKVTGTKNAASTATSVIVDAFTVGTSTTQESSTKIKYNTWKGGTSANASGGTYRSSATAGAVAQFKFTGTSVDWVTATGPGWGKARVFIDNVDKGIVDLFATVAHWQTLKSFGGLAAGQHTIRVQVLGTKNAAATGTTVSVDGFIVR
jgi:hypothetical protein